MIGCRGLAGLTLVLAALSFGCSRVGSSSVQTGPAQHAPHAGPVRVMATIIPPGAQELGAVQAYGHGKGLADILPAFQKEVAKLGGNWGKVDSMVTKFTMQTRTRQESYQCGSANTPQTCTRMVTEQVEVATTTIMGRAYRVEAQ
jgi:hypothetical protein